VSIRADIAEWSPRREEVPAGDLDPEFEHVRHCYRALQRVGLVTEYEGSTIKASERKLTPRIEIHRKRTDYVAADTAEGLLRELDGD
jgi:predicted transcriptional regulator